jgi:hypothetical protein
LPVESAHDAKEDGKMSETLKVMSAMGVPLRGQCSNPRLIFASPDRDKITISLTMDADYTLFLDDERVETVYAELLCMDTSYAEVQAKENVTGVLQSIADEVYASIALTPDRFRALQAAIASGIEPTELVINVRDVKSEGYGTGKWLSENAVKGSLIASYSLMGARPAVTPDSKSDSNPSAILFALSKIEQYTAMWDRARPWVIGLLTVIAVFLLLKKN